MDITVLYLQPVHEFEVFCEIGGSLFLLLFQLYKKPGTGSVNIIP